VNGVLEAAARREASGREGGRPKQQIQLAGLLSCCEISGVAAEEEIAESLSSGYCCRLEELHQLTAGFRVTWG
jgi:hypothetical protein